MRLCYVVDTWPHATETFVLREIVAAADSFDVRILALEVGNGALPPEAERLRNRVTYLPQVVPASPAGTALRHPVRTARAARAAAAARAESGIARLPSLLAYAEKLSAWGVTRIHAHFARWATAAAEVLSAATGAPFGFTAHAYDVFASPLRLAEKAAAASWRVVCNAAARREIQRVAGPVVAAGFRVIRHGVDLDAFRPREGDRAPGPFRVLHVGSLVALKRHDVLVDALADLAARKVPFEARFVGGGPEEDAIRRRIAEKGLQGTVALDGQRPVEEVRLLLRTYADALAIVSTREGLPNVVGEAMACGVPVVGTPVGGIPEMLEDGRTGLVVPVGDPASTAAALARLAADPALRTRLGAAGRGKAEEVFDARRNLRALFDLVEAGG